MVYRTIVVKREWWYVKATMDEHRLSYALYSCNWSFTSSDYLGICNIPGRVYYRSVKMLAYCTN